MSSYIFSHLNVLSLLTPYPWVQLELYPCFTYQMYTVLSKVCPPASSVTSKSDRSCKSPSLVLNLPGWRWGSITQNPLVAVSRPLHSGVCETRQDIGLPVLHSEISDSGLLRTRGDQQYKDDFWIYQCCRAITSRRVPSTRVTMQDCPRSILYWLPGHSQLPSMQIIHHALYYFALRYVILLLNEEALVFVVGYVLLYTLVSSP